MTIQISVLIWTVITFCVLMFFLNRCLFRPLLAFMDAREEKIARARRLREEALLAQEAARKAAEERHALAEKEARAALEAVVAQMRESAMREMDAANERYARLLEMQHEQIETDKRSLQQQMNDGVEKLVSSFLQRLTS